ncbi:hypothetical protein LCGC14_0837630 [marine sediment metagenome]|uniref:HNH nuclease domain-containing protein n=1 Tax=marine sediment metagenome TaxID=412755 RepID=A0A0F9RYS2_9ZZZZ
MTAVADSTTRVCRTCGVEKPLASFHRVKQWRLRDCGPCCYIKNHAAIVRRRERYYQNNKEKIKAKNESYRLANWAEIYAKEKEVRKQRAREYYHTVDKPKNLELYGRVSSPERLEKNREYRGRNRELYGTGLTPRGRLRQQERYQLLRLRVMEYYGGKCECCGEDRYEHLTIDHLNGHARKTGKIGVYLTYDAIREFENRGYPNRKYRLLCWNCNLARGYYGYCPHEGTGGRRNLPGWRKQIKLEMIAAYGGACVLCGERHWEFLTIDHINGGGNAHRKLVGVGAVFYRVLKSQGWPKDEYRLLCAGCNCSTYLNEVRQRVVRGAAKFPNC